MRRLIGLQVLYLRVLFAHAWFSREGAGESLSDNYRI